MANKSSRLEWTYNDGGRSAAGFKGSARGDCVCRAIAIASDRPYEEIYDLIDKASYRERQGKRKSGRSSARTGVYKPTIRRILQSLGFTWIPTMSIGSGCKVHLRKAEIPMTGKLIVSVSKHLCAVIDGVINDTHDPSRDGTRCVYGYWVR